MLRQDLGRSGREYVLRHYNRDRLAAEYATALEETVISWQARRA